MARVAKRLALILGVVAVTVPSLASMAGAAPPPFAGAPVTVSLRVDHADLTVDLDSDGKAITPPVLNYEVIVANESDDLVPAVVVRGDLPAGLRTADGKPIHLDVGDMGARAQWRGTFTAEVDHTALDRASVSLVAIAAAGDGSEVSSEPATTQVRVISANTVERLPDVAPATPAPAPAVTVAPAPPVTVAAPAPSTDAAPSAKVAPRVLGVTYTRFADGTVATSLPRTGAPLVELTIAGLLVLLAGFVLVRRSAV